MNTPSSLPAPSLDLVPQPSRPSRNNLYHQWGTREADPPPLLPGVDPEPILACQSRGRASTCSLRTKARPRMIFIVSLLSAAKKMVWYGSRVETCVLCVFVFVFLSYFRLHSSQKNTRGKLKSHGFFLFSTGGYRKWAISSDTSSDPRIFSFRSGEGMQSK